MLEQIVYEPVIDIGRSYAMTKICDSQILGAGYFYVEDNGYTQSGEPLESDALDSAIDAAMAREASHEQGL